MDIENFSKTEIVLTAFLVSFVTAILVGVVIILLSEDAPKDIIRVTERFISEEEMASSSATTSNQGEASSSRARDEILDQAVRAVARITAEEADPRAGVLIELAEENILVTEKSNSLANPQALFEDGTVANLQEMESSIENFFMFSVINSSDSLYPLSTAVTIPGSGAQAFVVPLSERPEIVQVSIQNTSEQSIITSTGNFPAGSLLLTDTGEIIGVYDIDRQQFQLIK